VAAKKEPIMKGQRQFIQMVKAKDKDERRQMRGTNL